MPSQQPSESSEPVTEAQDFKNKCVASVLSENGIDYSSNPENSYVDCVLGYVRGTSTPCDTACNRDCCTGFRTCVKFTGKGEQLILIGAFVLFMNQFTASITIANTFTNLFPSSLSVSC